MTFLRIVIPPYLCLSMIFSENRYPLFFPDHAREPAKGQGLALEKGQCVRADLAEPQQVLQRGKTQTPFTSLA